MGASTAFAVAAFGMLLASACKTRAQLGALSTLVILIMSSIGGSMFPWFLMPGSHAKGRTADHQRMGDRRLHESVLARRAGHGPLAASRGFARHRDDPVSYCAR